MNCASPGMKITSPSSLLSLNHLKGGLNGPIVVFPEGTTSNGRALLPFTADMASLQLPPNQRVHIFGIKHVISDGGYLPTLPINGYKSLMHFCCRLASQWYNSVLIKWISAECLYSSNAITSPDQSDFLPGVAKVMQSMLHLRTVNLPLSAKEAFLAAYFQRISKKRL